MMKKWLKLGLLYTPKANGCHPKLISHTANPLPVLLEGDIYRIFYSGRDQYNRSSVGAVDIDIIEKKVIHDHVIPFFEHGPAGSFYADGVSIGNCYEVNGIRYMLFMGWQTPDNGHWRGDIGRLIVNSDLSLELDNEQPFMSTDSTDLISLSYPWVMPDGRGGYHMWYGSTVTWDAGNDEMLHVINYASSFDGENWDKKGLAIPYELNVAQAFSRPTIIGSVNDGYQMWFSYRSGTGEKYRIGYATSVDGISWKRELENTGLDVSLHGWDSEMIEYPFVLEHKGKKYMIYNGNSNGRTGFGLAVMSK
jgi:hypothetical protein